MLEQLRQSRLDMATRLSDHEGEVLPVQKLTLSVESSSMLRELSSHLDVDLPNLQDMKIEQVSNKDFEKVKLVLLALSEKATVISALEQEVNLLRAQISANKQSREDLQQTLIETTEQLKKDAAEQDRIMKVVQEERANAVFVLHEKHIEGKKIEEECEILKTKLAEANRQIAENKLTIANLSDVKAENENLRKSIAEGEKRRKELVEEIERFGRQIQTQASGFTEELQKQAKLRDSLQGQIRERDQLYDQLRQELTNAKIEIVTLNAQITSEKNLKASISELEQSNKVSEQRNSELLRRLNELQTQSELAYSKYAETEDKLLKDKQKLHMSLNSLEAKLEEKEQSEQELTRQLYEAKLNIATLEQLCCLKEDMHQLLEQLGQQNEAHEKGKDLLQDELNFLSEQNLLQAQKTMEQSRLLGKYSQLCENRDEEMDELKLTVLQLQQRSSVYTPAKDDPVDTALAEYLNARAHPLLVPFQRQDQDLYLFGTRRIFMKLENGRITVRVGGGFTRIEEFIEVYTPLELERTNARLANSVLGPKKVLGKLITSVMGREPMSPKKAARIIQSAVESGSTKYGTFFGVRKSGRSSPSKGSSSPAKSATSPTKGKAPSERRSLNSSQG